MYSFVDKFVEEVEEVVDEENNIKKKIKQEKIYDSSYIIWVPYIQLKLKPWLRRFKEKKRLQELEKEHLEEELAMISTVRRGSEHSQVPRRQGANGGNLHNVRIGSSDLIIETGS
jgi:hypothetical protein